VTARDQWPAIARQLQAELPGEWSIRGAQRFMVKEPVEWLLSWIAYGHTGSFGTLSAGVTPLIEAFTGWHMKYGLRMDSVPGGPRSIDLNDPDAPRIARDFALGPALQEINEWSLERLADIAERDLARPPRKRDRYSHLAPACRVIFDTGSPEEAAREIAEKCREQGIPGGPEYYEGLIAAWQSGGRDEALQYLRQYRDKVLADEGMDQIRS
jgi:hypothetical protein